jgi:hypothetical protein
MTCPWCESPGPAAGAEPFTLPEVFCWTKMQAEAGQPLELILRRKEAERTAGAGQFFWGIGTSVAGKVLEMLERVPQPKVMFSAMKATPKPEDVSPAAIFLWTSYVDLFGRKHELPDHAIVLSRAYTKRGFKTHHYALVCRSEARLCRRPERSLQIGHFRNLGSRTPRIGSSQVTAVIEHLPASGEGPLYGVDLVADLAEPYFVRLCDPVLLPRTAKESLDAAIADCTESLDWWGLVRGLRRRVGLA